MSNLTNHEAREKARLPFPKASLDRAPAGIAASRLRDGPGGGVHPASNNKAGTLGLSETDNYGAERESELIRDVVLNTPRRLPLPLLFGIWQRWSPIYCTHFEPLNPMPQSSRPRRREETPPSLVQFGRHPVPVTASRAEGAVLFSFSFLSSLL
ncbi:hypothetical protein BHM03_00054560 [Ensete ventricosum]|nr:hypothetical protein BHM03_00054560 [Ensete ventricosum]